MLNDHYTKNTHFLQWLANRKREEGIIAIALLYPIALFYSKFTLTICMIAWLVLAVFDLQVQRNRIKLRLNPALKEKGLSFFRSPFFWITFFFWIVLLSGIYTADQSYWLERIRIKLPFLGLPVAFFLFPSFSARQIQSIFYAYLLVLLFSCMGVGMNYLSNFSAITEGLGRGHPIPTPVSHIRYSLMLAFGIIIGAYLVLKGKPLFYKWERPALAIITLFFFGFIHILSVRSGLLTLYMALSLGAVAIAIEKRKVWLAGLFLIGLAILPVLAYQFIPSFRNRIDYARYDWQMYRMGKGQEYSDSDRMVSLQTGLAIAKEHPLFGVGAGDLKREVKKIYNIEHPDIEQAKMPHNQLLSVWAGTGLFGLLLFLCAFFVPLLWNQNYRKLLFSLFCLIIFTSFMMENTLESAVGIAFYSFFLLLFLNASRHLTPGR
jgi:O-antigen ligase